MDILEALAKAFEAAAERAAVISNDGTMRWIDQRNKELFEELAAIARGEGQ